MTVGLLYFVVHGDRSKPSVEWPWYNNGYKKDKGTEICRKKYFVHKYIKNIKRRTYTLKSHEKLELVHILEREERTRKRHKREDFEWESKQIIISTEITA